MDYGLDKNLIFFLFVFGIIRFYFVRGVKGGISIQLQMNITMDKRKHKNYMANYFQQQFRLSAVLLLVFWVFAVKFICFVFRSVSFFIVSRFSFERFTFTFVFCFAWKLILSLPF